MPAAISLETRSRIVYYAALGYSQGEISDEIGVSRNTVRKYLREAREIVEDADEPKQKLAAIVQNEDGWEKDRQDIISFGDHPA